MTADAQATAAMVRTSDRLAQVISGIAAQAKIKRATGFIIPVLETDPDADDPTNLWLFADGQLNSRTPDGTVHRYSENTGKPAQIPTFSSNPSFSSGHRLWFDGTSGELRGFLANGNTVRYAPISGSSSTPGGGPTGPGSSSSVSKPADPKPKSYSKTYTANWGRIFCEQHGVETGDNPKYGRFDGTHGERRIMFGFPDGTMRSDMSGAKITKVELRMRNTDAWAHAGVDIHFGLHKQDAAPSSWSQTRKDVYVGHWPESGWGGGSDKWRTVAKSIGERFRDDSARGMTIDQPSGRTSYGEADWSSLSLRISYTK